MDTSAPPAQLVVERVDTDRSLDAENAGQSFADWQAFEIARPSRDARFSFVALAGGEVVGYASLDVFPHAAYHGLTAVKRAWRRRGIARALELAQIRAAKAAGYERLETESEEGNVPMRRLNESLGYRPIPGMVVLRGPLVTAPPPP